MRPQPAAGGIVVLGPHRSGTSAVTGVLDSIGLHACAPEDRMPVRRWNPRGNFESQSLSRFDERLLNHLGGAWWAPPSLPDHWQEGDLFTTWRQEARELFAATFKQSPWVWKDPRACTLMPFWDDVLGPEVPRLIVLRHPVECARSLNARNQMSLEHGLALTERCLRSALRDSAGKPALIATYDALLRDPTSWCREAAGFIARHCGVPAPPAVDRAIEFLDRTLRHQVAGGDAEQHDGALPPDTALWSWASGRVGAYESLPIDEMPAESPRTSTVLAEALG